MGSLRVISGVARGRRLHSVPGDTTRPITDRAKESLFNILAGDIQDSFFLDMFAGTGCVGIEALSRGAAFARFLDISQHAIETIRTNLKITQFENKAEVMKLDILKMLERPADMKFDYFFIAPPQYKGIWKRALKTLDEHPDWMSDDSWVIVQIHPVEYELIEPINFSEFDQRKYGSTLFVFYERS